MLDLARSKSRTFGVYLIFGTLIVAFAVGFGAVAPEQACGTGPSAHDDFLEVNGHTIDRGSFLFANNLSGLPPEGGTPNWEDAYAWRFPFARLVSPFVIPSFNRDPREASPLRPVKVADDLIETHLVSDYVRSLGLDTSDAELTTALRPFLRQAINPSTGQFSDEAYRSLLANYGGNATLFESLMSSELLRERAIRLLVGEAGLTNAELEQHHRLESERVTIEMVHLNAQSVAPFVKVSPEEIETSLTERSAAISAQYESQKMSRYATLRRFQLRLVQLEAPDLTNRSEDERAALKPARDAVKARAEVLLTEMRTAIDKGEDAASAVGTIAQRESKHASAAEGGRVGPISLPELEGNAYGVSLMLAVRNLKAGELSPVIETDNGYWVAFAESIEEPQAKPLVEVQREIAREQIQLERASALLPELAKELQQEAQRDPSKPLSTSVTVLAGRYNVTEMPTVSTLGLTRLARLAPGFPLTSPLIPNLGARAPALVNAAFAMSAEKPLLEAPVTLNEGKDIILARFLEHTPTAPLTEKDLEEKRQTFNLERQRGLYRGWYEDYLAEKLKSKQVDFHNDFVQLVKDSETNHIQGGGKLPGSVLPIQ